MEIYGNGCRELLLADPDLERQLVSSDSKEMVEGKANRISGHCTCNYTN